MGYIDWKRKLTSRKFWTAVASFVSMMVVACGGTQDSGVQVAALIMAGSTTISYIIGEGFADARADKYEFDEFIESDGEQDE